MSQPKRYLGMVKVHPPKSHGTYPIETIEDEVGDWVKWDDYAALAAKNERLRKAGDAMFRYVGKSPEHSIQMDRHDKSKRDWLAAKEGRDAK